MNSKNLEQLTDVIQNESSENLTISKVCVEINNDGGIEDQSKQLNLQSSIDINLSQLNETGCCFDEFGRCVTCPSNS